MWHIRPTSSCDTVNTLLNLTQWTHFWVWHDGLPSRCDMMDAHLVVNTGNGAFSGQTLCTHMGVTRFLSWCWHISNGGCEKVENIVSGTQWTLFIVKLRFWWTLPIWLFGMVASCTLSCSVYGVSEMWYDGRNLRRDTVKTVSLRGWHILKNTLMFYTEKCNSMNVL